MRLIQNTTLQGLNLPLDTPTGAEELFLRPKASVTVPDSYNSKILENLIRRRMIKVVKVQSNIKPTLKKKK